MASPKLCSRKVSALTAGMLLLCGCTETRPSDERLRQQAARDAQQVHHDVKQAGREAQKALGEARRETKDIVVGAREGWAQGAVKDGPVGASTSTVDVNHASAEALEKLPGIHAAKAHRIVSGRPYRGTGELEKRGLLTHAEYRRIAPQIVAR